MTFAAVVRSELADGIADQIRDAILAGEYLPGDTLPSERELSQQFGANRTTIREGLAQLEHQGLIERRQGARCRVLDYRRTGSIELLPDLVRLSRNRRSSSEPSPLESTNEVLRIIYEGALDLAFERITAAEIAQLDELARDVETAAAAGDVVAVEHANRSFHQGVARTTHSIALELLVGQLLPSGRFGCGALGRQEGHGRQRADRPRQPGRPPSAARARRRDRRGQARRSARRRPPDARRRCSGRSHNLFSSHVATRIRETTDDHGDEATAARRATRSTRRSSASRTRRTRSTRGTTSVSVTSSSRSTTRVSRRSGAASPTSTGRPTSTPRSSSASRSRPPTAWCARRPH